MSSYNSQLKCSYFLFLILQPLREVEQVMLDTVRMQLDSVILKLTSFMQNELLKALKEIPQFKAPEVSMASGLSKIQFKIQKQPGEAKLPDVVVLMQDVIPKNVMYDSIIARQIEHPCGYNPPEGILSEAIRAVNMLDSDCCVKKKRSTEQSNSFGLKRLCCNSPVPALLEAIKDDHCEASSTPLLEAADPVVTVVPVILFEVEELD